MALYDTDAAFGRCSRMWRKLASVFEKHAYVSAEKGYLEIALKSARMAEVCFWQATGEEDLIRMKDVAALQATGGENGW